jgi:hypothetical protein
MSWVCRGTSFKVGEIPPACGSRSRRSVSRTVVLSPYSASATTAVTITPAAAVRRTSVSASRTLLKPDAWTTDPAHRTAAQTPAIEKDDVPIEAYWPTSGICRETTALLAAHDAAGSFLEGTALALRQSRVARLPQPGEQVAHYEILERLGESSMGAVYRALDHRLGRGVAIKFLSASLAQDSDWLRRFDEEARLAGSLNHPSVLTVHDAGMGHSGPYLVPRAGLPSAWQDLIAVSGLSSRARSPST